MRQIQPTPASAQVLEVLRQIPSGKVTTYGQVAAMAGCPGGARLVVRVLNAYGRDGSLAWYRVVGAGGKISLPYEHGGLLQRRSLEEEGVVFNEKGRIDLDKYGW